MLKNILGGLVASLAILSVVVSMQPTEYHVERSMGIKAPPEVVWAEISDFGQWQAWNPWGKEDPDQKVTVAGAPGTVGHSNNWVGEKTGEGSMTLSKIDKPNHLGMDLNFIKPFESKADTAFDLKQNGDTVKLTWSMDGKNNFVGKMFGLVMSMDTMIGEKYESGLANIKAIAESNAKKIAATETATSAQQ